MGAIASVGALMAGGGLLAMGINMGGSGNSNTPAIGSSQTPANKMMASNEANQITGQFQEGQQANTQQAVQYNDSSNRQYNDNPLKLKNILDQLNR